MTAAAGPNAAPGPQAAPARPRTGPRARLLILGAGILARLPEALLVAAAEAIGELWYRVAPTRAAQARANLARACGHLAATGRGTALARRAATDPAALELLVRKAFRHVVRYYLEVARTGSYDIDTVLARLEVETPDAVRAALERGSPVMIVGMHFGAIELPVVFISHLVGHRVTAPMETLGDPGLQRWLIESRGRVGVDIVPIRDTRHALMRAAREGRSVGMVADRDITGGGVLVPFFGHPAPMPAGAAVLALELGIPVYAGAARRAANLRYKGRLMLVPSPTTGTRRERTLALTAAMATAFESLIADAPEQWWGAFHHIWPDLVVGTKPGHHDAAGAEAPR